MSDPTQTRYRLREVGQEQLLRFWPTLTDLERARLLRECEELDWALVQQLSSQAIRGPELAGMEIAPPPVVWQDAPVLPKGLTDAAKRHFRTEALDTQALREHAATVGESLLREGRVAFVLVAGGQATRLGYDLPKGCFPIGPVSGRCLFEIHAARIRAIGRRTGRVPLWFVMTSPSNHATTQEFFERQQYFGIHPDRIALVPQDMVPAFDRAGKLLLETPSSLFRNPNGHGGSLWALSKSGFLERCRAEGVEHLFYWQVDNPLARIGDPLFLGLHHVMPAAGMSSKVVSKRGPGEKVGILALDKNSVDGRRTVCVEYSDLSPELRDARDADGELVYRAGNVAIHAFRVSFVESLTKGSLRLPWHRAEKKIRALSESGELVDIAGVKFETFVFDALPLSEQSVSLEVRRQDEFAPVKNASGEDSPDSAREAVSAYFRRWFRKAGIPVTNADGSEPAIEVDPSFALDYREFSAKRAQVPENVDKPLYLDETYLKARNLDTRTAR